ncbi:DUF58 domain-containing protein [Lignipirellula cremea]|uniref:DUF58 domain-containing protein n=1 Tax=Lignipirellula cremea TaxID=2528010 RepID=A0A518E1T8_9BACT|nr:DUF58 domain-containing protein [Lignipirellula cremea]QDU98059.1 hypothetical protein Pla8534_59200 [Lignipirellula cremea]
MAMQRRVHLRREGWYYLLVLLFVMSGAILRQVNLLQLLAGLMVGPLLLNWRVATVSIRRLRFRRTLPRRARAGDSVRVNLNVANERRTMAGWAIVLEDPIQRVGSHDSIDRSLGAVMVPRVNPGDQANASYRCELPRRGKYQFGPLHASTRFPLGLVEAIVRSSSVDELLVAPRLGLLSPQWRRLANDDQAGSQRTQNRQGVAEGELYGLREWRRGDSRRWIHWRTSAKLNELIVRQFEQQRNLDLAIVLDLWLPADPSAEQEDHLERVISFAATVVAERCRQGGGSFTVAIAGQQTQTFSAAASPMFRQDLFDRLAVVHGGSDELLPQALDSVFETASRGARLIVLSPREVDTEQLAQHALWDNDAHKLHAFGRTIWIDVSSPQSKAYFRFDEET